MITENMVKDLLRYPPERLPDSWVGNVPNLAELAPAVLELRNFKPNLAILTDMQVTANANVELRARYDDARIIENTASMLSALVGAWRLPAKDYLWYSFFGWILVANYTTHYSVWVVRPTIAHKLFWGITLSNDERAICDEYGVKNTVEKGLLPLPVERQIEREYHVVGEETHPRSVDIAVANTAYTLEGIYPKPGEFVVLTRVAANPGLVAQNIRLIIGRDEDSGYIDMPTFPLSLVAGGEVNCFIPAMRELRLTTRATVAPGPHLFRYTFQRIKLNNTLRVRFGLVSRDEVPKDLYDKVIAGIV